MPVHEIESKERTRGSSRGGDMEMSEKQNERSKQRGAVHSQLCHLRHLHNGGRDRATQLIVVQLPDDAGE